MKRLVLTAVAAILVAGALAAGLIWWTTREVPGGPAAEALPTPPVPPPAVPPLMAPPEPTDPQVLRERAEREEARARYRSLRDAFAAGRPSPGAQARLDPALRTLAKAGSARWKVACRGTVCRIDDPGAPAGFRDALAGSEAVRALADRTEADPDGVEAAAYLLLAPQSAAAGGDVLAEVERRLRESGAARKCLAESPQKGAVRYDLEVDTTGVTYHMSGDLPWPVVQCVNLALADSITATDVPAAVKSSSRSVTLRTPP